METDEGSWRRAGLDEFDVTQPPGASDLVSQGVPGEAVRRPDRRAAAARQQLPLGQLPHPAHPALARARSRGPVVFLGDAVHTAHFSVGSGTKMAMEDAVALAAALAAHPGDLPAALAAYEAGRAAVGARRSRTRRGRAWPGGSTSGGTTTRSSPGSSRTTSCPAASPTLGWPGATPDSSRPATGAGSTPTVRSRCRRRSSGGGWRARGAWSRSATGEDGVPTAVSGSGGALALSGAAGGPWGALVTAPESGGGPARAFSFVGRPGAARRRCPGPGRRARRHGADPDTRLRAGAPARATARVAGRPRSRPGPRGHHGALRSRRPVRQEPARRTVVDAPSVRDALTKEDAMPSPIVAHTVPWPAADVERYVADGYWLGTPARLAAARGGRPVSRRPGADRRRGRAPAEPP